MGPSECSSVADEPARHDIKYRMKIRTRHIVLSTRAVEDQTKQLQIDRDSYRRADGNFQKSHAFLTANLLQASQPVSWA